MTLRAKTFYGAGIFIVCMVVVLYATAQVVLLSSFEGLETENAHKTVTWVQSALSDELGSVDDMTVNYSAWGQTYEYVGSPTAEWADQELSGSMLVRARINVMVVVGSAGQAIFSRAVNPESGSEIPVPAGVVEQVVRTPQLAAHASETGRTQGLVLFEAGPALVVSRPVVKDDGTGPPRGAVVMIRFIDAFETARLARTTHLKLEFSRPGVSGPAGLKTATSLTDESAVTVTNLSSDTVAGYVVIPDLDGRPATMVTVINPRSFYSRGASAVRSLLLIVFLFALAGGGALAWAIWTITGMLQHVSHEVRQNSRQVVAAAAQVSGAAQSLAQGSSTQAASLEETSASMEEMASMTHQTNQNTREAAHQMELAATIVGRANVSLQELVASMAGIKESSLRISKINKTIDEIAFQTNILALNAAVEAARAGEAGLGFAVVADEVRNLAQRAGQAAKDTAVLIEESISRAQEGENRVGQVGQSITEITGSAMTVKGLVDHISAATGQQSQGITQVTQAVTQMERVTQSTAATAQEAAAASEELSAQAEASMAIVGDLDRLVSGRIVTGESPATPARAPGRTVVRLVPGVRQGSAAKPLPDLADGEPGTGTFGRF